MSKAFRRDAWALTRHASFLVKANFSYFPLSHLEGVPSPKTRITLSDESP